MIDLWVHVAVKIGDAVTPGDIHPKPPREVGRVQHDRRAVDILGFVLFREEARCITILLPRSRHGQFALEALRKFVLVGCVREIAWPVVEIVDVAINHEAVRLAAPLRIEFTVARHDPVEIFLRSAEVIEILIKWFQQPNFGE